MKDEPAIPQPELHPDLELLLGVERGISGETLRTAFSQKIQRVQARSQSGPRAARQPNLQRLRKLESLESEVTGYALRWRARELYERAFEANAGGHLARAVAAWRKGTELLERAPDEELSLLFSELEVELGPAIQTISPTMGPEFLTRPPFGEEVREHLALQESEEIEDGISRKEEDVAAPLEDAGADVGVPADPETADESEALENPKKDLTLEGARNVQPPEPEVVCRSEVAAETSAPDEPGSISEEQGSGDDSSLIAEIERADRFTLRMGRRRLHVLNCRVLSMGRCEEADIPLVAIFPGNQKATVIAYRSISRQHVEVSWNDGRLKIYDGWHLHRDAEKRPSAQGVRLNRQKITEGFWDGRQGTILSLTPAEPTAHTPHWRLFLLDAHSQARTASANIRQSLAGFEDVGIYFRRGDLVREDILMIWGPANLKILGYVSDDVWVVPVDRGFKIGPSKRLRALNRATVVFPGIDLLSVGTLRPAGLREAQEAYE